MILNIYVKTEKPLSPCCV